MKEYLIVFIDSKYDYENEENLKEIKNIYVKANNKKEALFDNSLEFSIILNIIELGDKE